MGFTIMKRYIFKPLLSSLIIVFALAACDSNSVDENLDDPELAQLSASISDEVSLTSEQQGEFEQSLARHGGNKFNREPGFLWTVAADLQATLTDEQKEELFAGTEEAENGLSFRGLLGFPGSGGRYGLGGFMGGSRRHGISPMDAELNLTEEQETALTDIHTRYREQFRALAESFRNGEITEDEVLTQLISLRDAKQAEVLDVLTDEQEAILEEYRAQREADFEEYRQAVNDVRNEVLALTDEQAEAIDALYEEQLATRESLIEQVQAGTLSVTDFQAEIEALETARQDVLVGLLSELQYEIVQIHDALSVRSGKFGHRGGRGFGQGRGQGHTFGG